ncbi:hypothetical protein DUI87_33367 [Hirundo rustica rustica]|uniref:Condensin-2 complex subunit H2 n=1 Tax=Hirundo rustica rustica TaxID=333673 RepID=A0A3M0ILH0_HIRRU|nr:hypothetical protein DUI87_33367 [Hirundo rustica rustica]
MEEVDSRFLHLLQPIRDLTKNWEVDVAAQLGEYLEELDHICISFDNGKTTMNFMEAALLIQGSACIYSKKVEYLYMLVCQTLDCISNKKKEKLPSSLGPDGRDADATFTDKEEEAVSIVPLTPMSLVPPEEGEKKENPLLSRRGEVLASRRDFRINTSTPHASGAFLLELAGLSPTPLRQEQRLGTPTEHAPEPGYILRPRPPSHDPKALSKEEPNPWRSLDPFGDCEEKPFRKDDDFVEHEDAEPEAPEEPGEGSLEPPEPGYEELVRRNVELFMASSQKFAQETELSQRIRLWEERMEPLLQEQARTPRMGWDPRDGLGPLGVRSYGLALTQRCAEPGRWHSLASLVAGQPPFEVCRYLLASLQLANDAEVELEQQAGLDEALDTARLRLLSARPAHERFQNFQLPSQSRPEPQ